MTLELSSVVKRYHTGESTVVAVDRVSLEVNGGEFVALYGPSGSGKTTLLTISAGLLAPDEGSVRFDGIDLSSMTSEESARFRLSSVGFVFQSFHLMAGASALENAAIKPIGEGQSLRQAKRLARPWLERIGLGHRLDHPAGQLSMGERQRVAIARALVNEPRLLFADEPTGNLDSRRSSEILQLLGDICHEREIPLLVVTHDPLAQTFADRVHTVQDGRLSAHRATQTVKPR